MEEGVPRFKYGPLSTLYDGTVVIPSNFKLKLMSELLPLS
jgi:hypothetical protein